MEKLKHANDVLRKQLQQFSRALDKSLQQAPAPAPSPSPPAPEEALAPSDIEVEDPPRKGTRQPHLPSPGRKRGPRARAAKLRPAADSEHGGVAGRGGRRGRTGTKRSVSRTRGKAKAGPGGRRMRSVGRSASNSKRRPPKGHSRAAGGLRPVLEGRSGSVGRSAGGDEQQAVELRSRLEKERRGWAEEKRRLVAMLQARDKAGRALKGKVELLRGKLQAVRQKTRAMLLDENLGDMESKLRARGARIEQLEEQNRELLHVQRMLQRRPEAEEQAQRALEKKCKSLEADLRLLRDKLRLAKDEAARHQISSERLHEQVVKLEHRNRSLKQKLRTGGAGDHAARGSPLGGRRGKIVRSSSRLRGAAGEILGGGSTVGGGRLSRGSRSSSKSKAGQDRARAVRERKWQQERAGLLEKVAALEQKAARAQRLVVKTDEARAEAEHRAEQESRRVQAAMQAGGGGAGGADAGRSVGGEAREREARREKERLLRGAMRDLQEVRRELEAQRRDMEEKEEKLGQQARELEALKHKLG